MTGDTLIQHARQTAIRVALVLLMPLLAMQFTDEVNWGPADFLLAGVLVFAAGLLYRLASLQLTSLRQRRVLAVVVVFGLALVWAELAVGLFD